MGAAPAQKAHTTEESHRRVLGREVVEHSSGCAKRDPPVGRVEGKDPTVEIPKPDVGSS